ncbi:PREDICTED: uncharacterized protein LOC108375658, partial [Rhagoletis zephyria]|uniref:uncharacterized protein LOC108375658 n=1 Tax=Rhagoletis zephyria TaxID=28612 RepID=UPI000811584C
FEKDDGTYHTQSELIFNATRFENDMIFRCDADNVVLQINREKPFTSSLTLEVLYPPVVKVSPPEITVNTSDTVLLNCEYVANPASLTQVVWYRNGDLVNVNDTERYEGGNSENVALVIRSTDKEDVGNYTCQLSNAIGKGISEQQIDLDVQSPVHYEPGPATLTHFPLIAVKKKSVTFSCSVDDPGYPESNRSVKSYKNTAYTSSYNSIAPKTNLSENSTKSYTSHPTTTAASAPQTGDNFLINFHTVQALQPSEAEAAYEALIRQNSPLLEQHQQQHSNQTIQKETHALIGLNNHTPLCTLLTLTTFSPKSQILTLYNVAKTNMADTSSQSSFDSSSTSLDFNPSLQQHHQLSLYRKMGAFTHGAQMLMHPHRFRWLRGGRGPLQDIVTKDWTVEPVGLDSRTNYSCYAFNEGGKGVMATINLEVHAPPFFIKNLVPYTGMLHTSRTANLTCRIECVPRCEITWLKGTEPIDKNDTRYFIKEKYLDASPATGDFESMLSVLHFNMSNWPNHKFDIEADSANYTCVSTGNTVGPGIKSSTYFSIEYAPENSTVSDDRVYVQEGTIPGRVICNARANP